MVAEPDHLLWECLCCEYWAETFMLRSSLSVSHSHRWIYTSLYLTWSDRGWFYSLLSTPTSSRHLYTDNPRSHSPQTLTSEQNSWSERGLTAGPDLSCRKMTHLLKKPGKSEKRFWRENTNKGVLIWWSPVAYKDKWRTAKEKLLTIQTLWMTAWRPKWWNTEPGCRAMDCVGV